MVEPTEWLQRLKDGDEHAAEELFPLIYDELRRLAHRQMQGQSAPRTLQTTALVHEAWIRLAGKFDEDGDEVLHFRALAATAMRSVLVDRARARRSDKRGGGRVPVTLADGPAIPEDGSDFVLDLHAALEKLSEVDPQLSRIAELRCFSGLEHKEVGQLLDVSTKTVERRWKTARAWLQKELDAPLQ